MSIIIIIEISVNIRKFTMGLEILIIIIELLANQTITMRVEVIKNIEKTNYN